MLRSSVALVTFALLMFGSVTQQTSVRESSAPRDKTLYKIN